MRAPPEIIRYVEFEINTERPAWRPRPTQAPGASCFRLSPQLHARLQHFRSSSASCSSPTITLTLQPSPAPSTVVPATFVPPDSAVSVARLAADTWKNDVANLSHQVSRR